MSQGPSSAPPSLTPSMARRMEAICDRFETAWKAGERPRIEIYLDETPEPERSRLLRELLLLELEYRRRNSQIPTLEEYQSRFPGQSALISAVFSALPTSHIAQPSSWFVAKDGEAQDASGPAEDASRVSNVPGVSEAQPSPGSDVQITLTVTEGPHQGRVFSFHEHDNFIVGRAKCAHFQLPFKDRYFSRVHFMVEVNPPHCRLVDMGSTNGTFVNGQRVPSADLNDGDQIRGGKTVIRLSVKLPRPDQRSEPLAESIDVRPLVIAARPPQPRVGEPARAAIHRVQTEPTTQCVVCLRILRGAKSLDSSLQGICQSCQDEIQKHPQPIDGYAIVRELGRGGMGIVYLAVRKADSSITALKTIKPAAIPSRRDVERFLREASILQQLDHPKIVGFREMGVCRDQLYFAMDYIRGTDAATLLRKHGPLPIPRAVNLVCQLLEALEFAHAKGFVHRDIKPANLLVSSPTWLHAEPAPREPAAGQEPWCDEKAKLADFGLARVYQASRLSGLTMTGDIAGTIPFMAPEQITNYREAKPFVDIYAAGATLYNLLTNRYSHDFGSDKRHHLLMILEDAPVPLNARRSDVPEPLANAIHCSLDREPEKRFVTTCMMRMSLEPFKSG